VLVQNRPKTRDLYLLTSRPRSVNQAPCLARAKPVLPHARSAQYGRALQEDDASSALPAEQQLGAVYGLIGPTNRVTVSTGQWNQCRLLVRSNHVEHWLNGQRIADLELNSPAFDSLVAASSFSSYAQFGKARRGFIAFQNWTPEIWYRNIKVRPLP